MSVITIESKAFKIIVDKLTFLEQTVKALSLNNGHGRWITEEEAMMLTNLSKRSLQRKRKKGEFNYSTATGRKIKYLRKDVEAYLNNNSTLRQ
ncbi:MAG TPA: helix-turn-helix domain-containing protein [Hanamia sp.]|nr:helix-turn-helix domain-containing protein [Hanamia sp.]